MADNTEIQAALDYHEETKHSSVSVYSSRHFMDWDNKPCPFKVYRGLKSFPLPIDFPLPKTDALSAISTIPKPTSDSRPLDIERLTELLFFTAGLTREIRTPMGQLYFRAAPATGALYPNEVYVVCTNLSGLEAGVYHFSPGGLSLTQLRSGDFTSTLAQMAADSSSVAKAPVTLVFSSIAWRNAWKYEARSYRHWFWDSGVMVANLLATATSSDLPTRIILGFRDDLVNNLLGLDGLHEAAVALVSLGESSDEPPKIGPQADTTINIEVEPLSRTEIEYPEIHHIHEASSIRTVEQLSSWLNAAATRPIKHDKVVTNQLYSLPEDYPQTLLLDEVILRRGSTRRFKSAPISFAQLSAILHHSTGDVAADFLKSESSLIDIYIIVNAVEELLPGSYFLRTRQRSLKQLKSGLFRKVSGHLCLDQALSAHASVVAFLMTDLQAVLECFGNRGYRAAQFEAGVIAGKMYLCAYALGLGASGLTFFDDDVTEFFSPHAKEKSNMIVVAIGIPDYKAKPGRVTVGRLTREQMMQRR